MPRWSTEQGRTACCVATTVTFVYVTSNDGSRPRAETLKDRHAVNPQNSMERNWHFKAGLGQVLVECRVDSARKFEFHSRLERGDNWRFSGGNGTFSLLRMIAKCSVGEKLVKSRANGWTVSVFAAKWLLNVPQFEVQPLRA